MKRKFYTLHLLTTLSFWLVGLLSPLQAASHWEPIEAALLSATECPSAPEAKAEVIKVEEFIDNDARSFYKCSKIYKADETTIQNVISLYYDSSDKIWNLQTRVTKPDGSTQDYTRDDFTESVALKTRNSKTKKLSASLKNVGNGDVVEMKWMRSLSTSSTRMIIGYIQDVFPTRNYTIKISGSDKDCTMRMFNTLNASIDKQKGDLVGTALSLPAYIAEPLSPPEMDVRGWYAIFFKDAWLSQYSDRDVWELLSSQYEEDFSLETKPNRAIKALVSELCEGAQTDDEKLDRLYNYCRTEINNLTYFRNANTEPIRKKRNDAEYGKWAVSDTLKHKCGYPNDITRLFGALARAAKFDVRYCLSSSKYSTTLVHHGSGYYFLDDTFVAIKRGEAWQLQAPGDYFVPPGMIHRSNEGIPYLLCEKDKKIFLTTPIAPASATPIERKARMTLDEEGNLEGDVEITFGGHNGSAMKQDWNADSDETVEKEFRETIIKKLPAAEMGDLKWENLRNTAMPLKVTFHLKIPAYGELLGERMAFVPSLFTKGAAPLFSEPTRKSPIFFSYGYIEKDDVEITFPEGYTLGAATAPANVTDENKIITVSYKVGYKGKARTLIYKREYQCCANGITTYNPAAYDYIKRLSELVNKSDSQIIMCKPKPEPAASTLPSSPAVALGVNAQ